MRWKWKAIYFDGTRLKKPSEKKPFLGDLDKSQVAFFIVKKGLKSFALDLRTGTFYQGKKIIGFFNLNGDKPEFFCVRRVQQHYPRGKNEKIVFGFKTGQIFPKLIVEENGDFSLEDMGG